MAGARAVATVALLVIITTSWCRLPPAAAVKGRCNEDDKRALLAIKAAFGNNYHFASWIPSIPCCRWYDVECDRATARVTELTIFQDDNITGTIPTAVGDLPYLQVLMFHHLAGVTGRIPDALGRLSKLMLLDISWTGVSGPVPAFLGRLKSLTTLILSFNSLSGNIPASLSLLPNLTGIDISRNHLTGALPQDLFRLVDSASNGLCYLTLSHNNLSGEIPASFGAIAFAKVDVNRNNFVGDASVLFGRNKPLQTLDLSRNSFSFDLTNVEFPEEVDFVDLSHNMITGSIPTQLTNLSNLSGFNVSYNRLCGRIPAGGRLAMFDQYSYAHNKCLCGSPLPPCN